MKLAVWAALTSALSFVMFIGGTYPWLGSSVVRLITQALVGSMIVVWLAVAIVRPAWRPRRVTTLPLLPPLVVAGVSALFSPVPRIALESAAQLACTALLFLLFTRLSSHPWFRPRISGLLVLLAVGVVAVYVAQVALGWIRWLSVVGAVAPPLRPEAAALTFGAPPIVAAFTLLLAPFALAWIWPVRRRGALVFGAAALAAILITGSRAAYVGLLLALVCAAPPLLRRRSLGRHIPVWLGRGWILIGLSVGAAAVALGGPLLARLGDINTIDQRLDIWASAVALFSASPLLGTGPGTWPILKFAANPPGSPNLVVPHAHSVPVQAAAEVGVIGLAALAVTYAIFIRRLVGAAGGEGRDAAHSQAAAALVGLAGLAGMSLVDGFANLPVIVVPMLLLVAWVVGGLDGWMPSRSAEVQGPRALRAAAWVRAWPAVVALAAVCAAVPGAARLADASLAAESASRAASRGEWTGALSQAQRAADLDPGQPVYWMELGTALAASGDLGAARREYRRVVEVDGYPMNLLSLAWLDIELGDQSSGLENARIALGRGPGDAIVALNVGAIAEAAGDVDLTTKAYASVLAMQPQVAAADYWTARSIPLEEIAAAARAQLTAAGSGGAIPLELLRAHMGDPGGAREALLERAPSLERERAIAVCLELEGRRSDAVERLRSVLLANPMAGAIAAMLSGLEADRGNAAAAARYEAWAQLVGVGTTARAVVIGSQVMTAGELLDSGHPENYPWIVYLRKTARILTPPMYLVIGPAW